MKPREPASCGPARLRASYPRPDAPEHFLLRLQRTIGNQAVLRMLRTHAEGSDTGSAAVLHGGFVQRDQKAPDAKQVAAERVAAAKKKLRAKFDLGEISEENKTTWTEDELDKIDHGFSKMSKEEQAKLKGVSLVRTDRLTVKGKGGKTIPVAAETLSGTQIDWTQSAFEGNPDTLVLHEAGHVIAKKVFNFWTGTDAAFDRYSAASKKVNVVRPSGAFHHFDQELKSFSKSIQLVGDRVNALSAGALLERQNNEDLVQEAQAQAEVDRTPVEAFLNDPWAAVRYMSKWLLAKDWLEVHDRQKDLVEAIRRQKDGEEKVMRAFLALVSKCKLQSNFTPFTPYVASLWPEKPEELLVQSYATWRSNPGYIRHRCKALSEWFERGGHLGRS